MAQPTREQFDAAAQKVLASAPKGLSREQFFALIDTELTRLNTSPVSPNEPDTFMEGFTKSIGDQASEGLSNAFFHNPMIEGAAHPQDLGDILSLIIPSEVQFNAVPLAKRIGAGAREVMAGPKGTGVDRFMDHFIPRRFLRGMGNFAKDAPAGPEGAQKVFNDLPTYLQQEELTGHLPKEVPLSGGRVGTPPPTTNINPTNDLPLFRQQQMMEQGGATAGAGESVRSGMPRMAEPRQAIPPARLRKGAPSTSLEDELATALGEGDPTAGLDSRVGGLPPEQGITPGGSTKQSGKFSKRDSKGQPGGYTSGRPAIGAEHYDDIVSRALNKESAAADPIASELESADIRSAYPDSAPSSAGESPLGTEAAPTSDVATPPASLEQSLREELGSRGAARELGTSQGEVKATTAEGPYQLPAEARARIDRALEMLTAPGAAQGALDNYIGQASPLARAYINSRLQ